MDNNQYPIKMTPEEKKRFDNDPGYIPPALNDYHGDINKLPIELKERLFRDLEPVSAIEKQKGTYKK